MVHGIVSKIFALYFILKVSFFFLLKIDNVTTLNKNTPKIHILIKNIKYLLIFFIIYFYQSTLSLLQFITIINNIIVYCANVYYYVKKKKKIIKIKIYFCFMLYYLY